VRCFKQNRRRGCLECARELVSWETGYNRRRFEMHVTRSLNKNENSISGDVGLAAHTIFG
jgi:hypothetical protein